MKNILSIEKIKDKFSSKIYDALILLSKSAYKYHVNIFLIGGIVRDLILDKPLVDVDIVVEGDAIKFCEYLEKEDIFKIIKKNKDFNTVKIAVSKDLHFDIASTRDEKYPQKGHLPQVKNIGCALENDILRRDFTVNALAISINQNNFGQIKDFTGGIEDINRKEIKILHDLSFEDDPTRIIRALRFKYRLNFNLNKKTEELQQTYLNKFENNNICYERVKQVVKLAFNLNSADLFDEFIEKNIYKLVTSKLTHKIKGKEIYNAINIFSKEISPENIWLIYLATLVNTENAQKLNLTAKELNILKDFEYLLSRSDVFESNYDIYNLFRNIRNEAIVVYYAITKNKDCVKYLDELQKIKLNITGNDLISLGFEQGEKIGKTLNLILEKKVNGCILTKNEELEFAQKILKDKNL